METVTVTCEEPINLVTDKNINRTVIRKMKAEQNLARQRTWLRQWDLEPNCLTSLQFH